MAIGTLSAEAQACEIAAARGLYMAKIWEWLEDEKLPVDLRVDCKSLQENLSRSWSVADKRTAVQIEVVKQDLKEKRIRSVMHIPRDKNYADLLTGRRAESVHERFRKMMNEGRVVDVG